ncbi:MAG: hypothetical protein D6754_10015 [Alphaproteobacteria bacterium]|nr:MAG: hypothetical protein D6754_10015 [Alphaproteobacteria bacterium]
MDLYFRIKENGAVVFRLDVENRNRRLEMIPVAQVNLRSGEIRVQGRQELSEEERAEIEAWIELRRAVLDQRDRDRLPNLIEALNEAAHWVQGKAPDAVIEETADAVLMAMHDLRSAIVRRKAERLEREKG